MSTDGRVPGYLWTPNARNAGNEYAPASYYPYKPIILLHMIVGMNLSQSYVSGHSVPPHLWGNPYNGDKFQTVELDRAAFALYQPQFGYHWTNKHAYLLQTELVGVPVVSEATYTDQQCKWIGENVIAPQVRWLNAHGLTIDLTQFRYHANTSGSASEFWSGRMSEQEMADFNGVMAHIDAWGNDHWDCSSEHIGLMINYAIAMLGGVWQQPPLPTEGGVWTDEMAYQAEDPDGTVWIVNPPFKKPMRSDALRNDYVLRGWLKPGIEKVHAWTLDELINVETLKLK